MATCSPPSDFDVLRARTEYLGPQLHARAVWKNIWLNLIPREEWPRGAGYVMSGFEIGRQYPDSPEMPWQTIAAPSSPSNTGGACDINYQQAYAGQLEKTFKPAVVGMVGPTVCQDDLTHKWESPRFWSEYFESMEKWAVMMAINRLGAVYKHYSSKSSCNSNYTTVSGKWATSQPPPNNVDMSDFLVGGALGVPTSDLTQQFLDATFLDLCYESATEGDTNGWINMSDSGPIFPILIGLDASRNIARNNPELRADTNSAWMGLKEMDPTLMRLGASKVYGNFRHVPNMFPDRYAYVPYGTTINITSTGANSSTGVTNTFYNSTAQTTNPTWTPTPVAGTDVIVIIPPFCRSTASGDVTMGQVSVVNGCWKDSNVTVVGGSSTGVLQFETAIVLNPLVMTEHVVLPTNSMPGMDLHAQNYMGQWKFVTGNDAFIGIAGCTGVSDPLHKKGRHFGEYRAAWEPVHPQYGRVIGFIRCANAYDTVTCS